MSDRRRLRAAMTPGRRADVDSGPPANLLRFRRADWYDPTLQLPEHVGSAVEDAYAYRASVARRGWSDAGIAWAREHGLSANEWITLRRGRAS